MCSAGSGHASPPCPCTHTVAPSWLSSQQGSRVASAATAARAPRLDLRRSLGGGGAVPSSSAQMAVSAAGGSAATGAASATTTYIRQVMAHEEGARLGKGRCSGLEDGIDRHALLLLEVLA